MFSWFKKRKIGNEKVENEKQLPDIESFLIGTGTNDHNKSYKQIIRYNNTQLESDHAFIQWVFPTETPSMFNPTAPVITKEQAAKLSKIGAVKENMHRMFMRMLLFYGIRLISNIELEENKDDSLIVIQQGRRTSWVFDKTRVEEWLQDGNHNLLRISRILESLRLFNRESDHALLCDVIKTLSTYKPEITKWSCWEYWTLYMAENNAC